MVEMNDFNVHQNDQVYIQYIAETSIKCTIEKNAFTLSRTNLTCKEQHSQTTYSLSSTLLLHGCLSKQTQNLSKILISK